MHKNYNKFNLISLLVILIAVLPLTYFFNENRNVIKFKDKGLEAAIRETIEKESEEILFSDVQDIRILNAKNKKIKYLDGIENLTELRELDLEDNYVQSLTPLQALVKLENLNLRNNEITNLEEINFQDIVNLNIKKLSLRHNVKRDIEGKGTRLQDISLLGNMVSLRDLRLRDNHISDLSPLSNLRKLKELDIRENKFSNIKPLESLTQLEKLNLRDNKIDTLKPIQYLTRLEYLNIHSAKGLESLQYLNNLINLETLIMKNVKVDDYSFLKNMTRLQRLNAVDTNLNNIDKTIIIHLLKQGALQEDVRPQMLLETLIEPVLSHESGFYQDEIELAVKGEDTVYYTLDGSEPSLNSNQYETPILISDRGDNFATVLRVKSIDENNRQSKTISRTFFVNENVDERFTLPIFSIMTDPDNLFDSKIGIYHDNNYSNKGKDWERPAQIDFLKQMALYSFLNLLA